MMGALLYYFVKPLIPRRIQIGLRRLRVRRQLDRFAEVWPIDPKAGRVPVDFDGWPGDKRFALVLTHDVDTQKGHDACRELMELEKQAGFRSSFNFVPERYQVSAELRNYLLQNGFEIGVHGLKHDGREFLSKTVFRKRAKRINRYIEEWGAAGYRSPSMVHNLDWISELSIDYDASTFDTDPFEPQNQGVATIFPFWFQGKNGYKGYVELPYTLSQDFTLFVLLQQKDIGLWKRKMEWIIDKGGMVLINTHPDYMNFSNSPCGNEEYPVAWYGELLDQIQKKYAGQYWHALPRDVACFWKTRIGIENPSHGQSKARGKDLVPGKPASKVKSPL